MNNEQEPTKDAVFVDTIPNLIGMVPGGEKTAKEFLQSSFLGKLDSMVVRYKSLGQALPVEPSLLRYLLEARSLFVEQYDWGAIALCGMTAESVCADVVRERILVSEHKRILSLGYHSQIDEISKMGKFRGPRTAEMLHRIGEIRREYVHLRRPQSNEKEIQDAFQMLRVAVFAEFGLVPVNRGKLGPASRSDAERLTRELGI